MTQNTEQIASRVPPEVDDRLDEMANEDGDRSKSSVIRLLIEESLEERDDQGDDHPLADRPDTVLAGLLWDARRDIHTFVLITLVSAFATSVTGGIAATVFGAIAVLYALTVTVGIIDAVVLNSSLTLWAADADADPEGVES
jgi:Arc/MetJ-type ribon-helix-helix transcriptional regulator